MLHIPFPMPLESPLQATPHSPVPVPLVTPMDRYAELWMCSVRNKCLCKPCVRVHSFCVCEPLRRSGRGYGPLSMRIQRGAANMFSLSLQVVGKNIRCSS
jgi:hypothetical protein